MEIDKQRNLNEDQMSDFRSFGSNYQRCSQSRKMSIGIAADLSANKSNLTGNRHNPNGQKRSPWISPKRVSKSRTMSESFNAAKKVAEDGACSNVGGVNELTIGMSLRPGSGKQKKVDTVVPGKESVKDVSRVTTERGNGSTQVAVEEIVVPNKGVKEPNIVENRSKETLKMKLWEVLRTVPPVEREVDGSKSDDADANVMMQKDGSKGDVSVKRTVNLDKMQKDGSKGDVSVKRTLNSDKMQKDGSKEDVSVKRTVNSDTIETDSENPEVAVSRPLTRSLSRKRGSAVEEPKGLRKKLFHANEEKNVFSFEEKSYRAQYVTTGKQLQSRRNSTGKKNLDIRMSKIQQASSESKMPSNADEISLRSGLGIASGIQDLGGMKKAAQREKSHSSPEANDSGQLRRWDNLISPGNEGVKDHSNGESAPKIANLINDIFGPANKMKANVQLPKPSDQAKEIESQNYTHMLAKRINFVKDAFRFKSTLTAKQTNLGSHFRTELSDGPAESDETVQSMKEKTDAELKHSERRELDKTEEELSISDDSGEDMDITPARFNCSEFSPIFQSPNVSGEHKDSTPEAVHIDKPIPHQNKQANVPPRFNYSELSPPFCFPKEIPTIEGSGDDTDTSPDVSRAEKHISSPRSQDIHEAVNYNDLSPLVCSPNGTRLTEASQEYQDGLEKAVALFGCSLENFKNKLVSSTKKRSSEVLESTAEEIRSKFQSAKSQIEKDVTNLTSASRSKRHVLEKSFNEQQEQLRLIHEKFRDEIHRHLEDFTRTVDSLQAHEIELKGAIERRKASHQKLLLHVEEAVENHLSDAQRRLISIQDAGRSKMLHLKTVIAACLEDGIFT